MATTSPNPRSRASDGPVSNCDAGSISAVASSMITRLRRATVVSRAARLTGGPNTSPRRTTTEPEASPTRTLGVRLVAADHVDDPVGGVQGKHGIPRSRTEPRRARLLIARPWCCAMTSWTRDSKISTRSPIRSSLISLESAVKDTQVGEADGRIGSVAFLLVRAEDAPRRARRLRPRSQPQA